MKLFSRNNPNPGSKAYPDPVEISLGDMWSVIDAQHGPYRLVGTCRDGVQPLAGHPSYRKQVGIALVLNKPREDGLATAEESEHIYKLEDIIQDELERDNQSLLVAKWFVRGCRELVFYTSDVKAMTRRLDEIAARGTTNAIQLATNNDPDWKVYRSFANAA